MAQQTWFVSFSGPRLAGLIDEPEGPVRGWGVFAHGFTLGKDSPAASRICKQLARPTGVLGWLVCAAQAPAVRHRRSDHAAI